MVSSRGDFGLIIALRSSLANEKRGQSILYKYLPNRQDNTDIFDTTLGNLVLIIYWMV